MQKEELLHVHMLLVQIKKYYDHINSAPLPTDEYDALGVSPMHIHKNKEMHRAAVMTLGNELVATMRAALSAQNVAAEKQPEGIPAEH